MKRILWGALLASTLAFAATPQPYAVVNSSNVIVNIVQWDGVTPYSPGIQYTLVATNGNPNAQIGGTYSGGVFTAPPPSTPQSIIDVQVPASGATVTLPNAPQPQATLYLIVETAATLSTLTVQLPPSPQDGDKLYLYSEKSITTLTVTAPGGQSMANLPATLAANSGVYVVFSAQYNTFFHIPTT